MCGVVGILGSREAAREAFLGLTTLQHRGQDAAGILTQDAFGFHQVKNLGLADSVFNRDNIETLTGEVAVAHARYSTTGRGDVSDVQPFLLSYPFGLAMVHNGNIVNHRELAEELRKSQWHILTQSDTEVILNLFANELVKRRDRFGEKMGFDLIVEALRDVYRQLIGSYSVVTLIAGHGLLAFRDPHGIRPLVLGKKVVSNGTDRIQYMVASESVALQFNGYEVVRNLEPGEAVYIDLDGKLHSHVIEQKNHRPCMFEWVYFASAESELDRLPVYQARIQLGRVLSGTIRDVLREKGIEVDLVAAVPDTARTSATAIAEDLKVPYREVLIKNRYIKRTFILASEDRRQKAVSLKLSPVVSEIRGKRVLLVDDSIVRGTTSKRLIELVRSAGAKEVVFVSTCPPIQYPCFYGIDFPNGNELVAFKRGNEEIEKELGADAVIYMPLEGLQKALHFSGGFRSCTACLDGRYPTDISAGESFARKRKKDRDALLAPVAGIPKPRGERWHELN